MRDLAAVISFSVVLAVPVVLTSLQYCQLLNIPLKDRILVVIETKKFVIIAYLKYLSVMMVFIWNTLLFNC